MKPWVHAQNSARKFGGVPQDYIAIHDWFDQTKAALPDMRHRAVLHNAMGCFLAEQVFGHVVHNSDGKDVPTRTIAEQHILEDVGFIPTLEKCFEGYKIPAWLGGIAKVEIVD